MKNAKRALVLGACIAGLVAWGCSPTQEQKAQDVNATAMKLLDAYCDKYEAAKGFEPLPDAGAPDAH